jgi:hypothetical protein
MICICRLQYHSSKVLVALLSLELLSERLAFRLLTVAVLMLMLPQAARCSQYDEEDQKNDQNKDHNSNAAARPGV